MSHPPGLTIYPSRAPLGAEIVGVDLAADMDEPTFRAIEDAYNTNLAMTSVTPVCTLADLILYAATRTALIAARRRP